MMRERKKSTYGGGTVYRRKDGRYVASIKNPNTGARVVRYARTQKEAEKKLEDIKFEIRQGTLATGPNQTLAQYLEYWLETVHRPLVRISTYYKNRGIIYNHLIPAIGKITLQKLTPYHVQDLCHSKEQAGLKPGTVRNIRQVLHIALDKAVSWGLVGRNVCDVVSSPKVGVRSETVLDIGQAKQLLEIARGNRLEGLLTLTVATGLRRGEILSLKWADVDLEGGSIQIRRTMSRVGKFGIVTTEPKTAKGRRKVILPQFVIEALKQHRQYQLERKEQAGDKWEENDFVFPNLYGRFWEPTYLDQMFKRLLVKSGLPVVRFHDLRHSAATILLGMGIHPKVVQELLGHSQISITLDTYSHVLPSMQQEAMKKLNERFNQ
ncbi:MAG TPA: tyrosine-type recombinase/integrase [Ktedonobacteraceae bacterium]|nr:tyrosine-type recombinase/integrase [Ktedonobacteraceae bacterium]